MKFLSEEQAKKAKQQLEEEMILDSIDETKEYTSLEINWRNDIRSWSEAKEKSLKLMTDSKDPRNIFIAHPNDEINGKPQLIHKTIQKITLLRYITQIRKDKYGEDSKFINQWKFIDDGYDRRYDGNITHAWSQDFWVYRVNYNNRDYYVLSKKELPLQNCKLKGMIVELNDFTEISKSMKIKSISRLFFLNNFEPNIKILRKDQIITFTKEREIDEEKWFEFLGSHELGTINRFPYDVELLRSSHLLSGKVDGWPLHLGIIGPPGTRKSMGHIETMAWKFSENTEIIEGANSRIKGLSPSFKEKPANIGYLARCERMGWVDELGKMVEFETNKHQMNVKNVLGELNFLLDHKKRTVGSGNDNECVVQAIAKFVFVTNAVSDKKNIYSHAGIIDPTTMSRILWWVQGQEEQEFVLSKKGIIRNPPTPKQDYASKEQEEDNLLGDLKGDCDSVGGNMGNNYINREEFLTLFDTCNSFLIDIDEKRTLNIHQMIIQLAKEPMKGIWKPRGDHHIKLIVDGICKHRCLFIDYDPTFNVKEEDYEKTEALLLKMIRNWDTDLSINKFIDYSEGNL